MFNGIGFPLNFEKPLYCDIDRVEDSLRLLLNLTKNSYVMNYKFGINLTDLLFMKNSTFENKKDYYETAIKQYLSENEYRADIQNVTIDKEDNTIIILIQWKYKNKEQITEVTL